MDHPHYKSARALDTPLITPLRLSKTMKYLKSSTTKWSTEKLLYSELYQLEFFIHRVSGEHFFVTPDTSFQVKGT